MVQYYCAGALSIVAGFMVLYYYYKKRQAENNNRHIYMLAIAIIELITGCIGICFSILDSINMLLFGMTMFWHMRRSKVQSDIVLMPMYIKGWLAAIFAIIYGILMILDHLNIFSLWREL